jgi:3-hydroxyisobutyrate dehydrogenase-like beta-hydroxyacid dehydrogenase
VSPRRVAVAMLGLGEAGSRLAADLLAAGVDVRGFDPNAAEDIPVTVRAPDIETATAGCDVVLSVNTAKVALDVATAALGSVAAGTVYADLNTATPGLKRDLAARAEGSGVRFADVGLLGPIPTRGLRAPALASGDGAESFADFFGPLGMPVTVVSAEAGDAAALKLVRSVFMKGVAAAVLESLQAAEALSHADWLRAEIAAVIGEPFLVRVLEGSPRHALRRVDEMEAARDLLLELGVEPRIASASASLLTELASEQVATAGLDRQP